MRWLAGSTRKWILLTIGVLVMLSVASVAATASAIVIAPGGYVHGHVTDPSGNPVSGVNVYAENYATGERPGGYDAMTTFGDGAYTLGVLPAGTYRIYFQVVSGPYLSEYYNDREWYADADPVTVASDGSTTGGIDAQLNVGGRVTGTVHDTNGNHLAGIHVNVMMDDLNFPGSWFTYESGVTSVEGTYDVGPLLTNDYRIYFEDEADAYLPVYFDGSTLLDTAQKVHVAREQVVAGIDATLSAACRIEGAVTDSAGTTKISDIQVQAWRWDGTDWICENTTYTGAEGTYTIGALPAAEYRVQFVDSGSTYQAEWFDGVRDVDSATPLDLTTAGSGADGVDATLDEYSHITGTVTDAAGTVQVEGVEVRGIRSDGSGGWLWDGYATTNEFGAYDMGQLAEGTYRVDFWDPQGRYSGEYWDGAKDLGAATGIPVAAGATVLDIDATLDAAGYITGHVTDASGSTDLGGIDVAAFESDGAGGWNQVWSAQTETDGTFRVGGLTTGSYRVRFSDPAGTYATECYSGAATLDAGSDVPVTAGAETPGIDATLDTAGRIAGKVTAAADGAELDWVEVQVCSKDASGHWTRVARDYTAAGGTYDIGGLRTGTYWVQFREVMGRGYAGEFYRDARTPAAAIGVGVTQGSTTSGVNATLDAGGKIAGTVTRLGDGASLAEVEVTAFQSDGAGGWILMDADETEDDGSYELSGLNAGPFVVKFEDVYGSLGTEWYAEAGSGRDAVPVAVTPGATTSGIDGTLGEHTYDLAPSASGNGAISPATTQTVSPGADATFTMTPELGYVVTDVRVDGVSVGAVTSYVFKDVQRSHTIAVTFGPRPVIVKTPLQLGVPQLKWTVRRNRLFEVYGTLKPAHAPRTKWVQLRFERLVRGRWRHAKTVSAWSYSIGSPSNHYGVWARLSVRGTYRVAAFHPADADGPAMWSAYKKFRVR